MRPDQQPPPPIGLVREHPAYGPPVQPRPPADFQPEPTVTDKPGVTNTEPVALAGAVQFACVQLIAVLIGFGIVHWTDAQAGIVLSFIGSVIAVGTAFARGKAWSPASVAKLTAGRR